MPPRIPQESDFSHLAVSLPHLLHFPSPPESTTTILILFHGLGDSEAPFVTFAQSVSLPGVLAISVRGTAPLPAALLPEPPRPDSPPRNFHWGDDLTLDPNTGDLDVDPGFGVAKEKVMDLLVRGVLIEKCGWETSDILFFGFGQGGSLALGLAASIANAPRVSDEAEDKANGTAFKGVVSLGGPLPMSMVSTLSARRKSSTPVLVCQLTGDETEGVQREFEAVEVVKWGRRGVDMPRSREEMLPIMKFFADRLRMEEVTF